MALCTLVFNWENNVFGAPALFRIIARRTYPEKCVSQGKTAKRANDLCILSLFVTVQKERLFVYWRGVWCWEVERLAASCRTRRSRLYPGEIRAVQTFLCIKHSLLYNSYFLTSRINSYFLTSRISFLLRSVITRGLYIFALNALEQKQMCKSMSWVQFSHPKFWGCLVWAINCSACGELFVCVWHTDRVVYIAGGRVV